MREPRELADLLASVLDARDRHDPDGINRILAAHPEHADALRACLDADAWAADAAEGFDPMLAHDTRAVVPPEVAGFTLLREVDRGGMGIVFEAEQLVPHRRVALKTLRDAALATDEDFDRFEREVQAAAELDHPGIVRILETGQLDGRPWYTMPFAEGGCLATHLAHWVGDRQRATRLARDVARAVAHGHARGILHRDLKPSNILLDGNEHPLVADFGLARRVEPGLEPHTRSGTLLGTPAYMAPEQARGDIRAIDERTDVWSLGAILYQLLTGRPPFVGQGPGDTIDQVLNTDPAPVRRQAPGVPRALATVCDVCLQKDPGDRYASMRDLADDLDRVLRDEPIRARTPGWWDRTQRWVRKHPARLASVVGGVVAITALVVAFFFAQDSDDARRRRHARELLARAAHLALEGDETRAALHYAAASDVHPSWEATRGLLAHLGPLPDALLETGPGPVWRLAWRPDGNWLVASTATGELFAWPTEGSPVRTTLAPGEHLRGLAFDPRGERLAVGDGAGQLWILHADPRTWTSEVPHPTQQLETGVICLCWIDPTHVAVGAEDGTVFVHETTGNRLRRLPPPPGQWDVRALAWDPERETLFVGYSDPQGDAELRALDLESGRLDARRARHVGSVWTCAVRGQRIVTGDDRGVHVLDAATLKVVGHRAQGGAVGALDAPAAFPVVTANVRGDVECLRLDDLEAWTATLRHSTQVYALAVHPAHTRLATAGRDGIVRLWPLGRMRPRILTAPAPAVPPARVHLTTGFGRGVVQAEERSQRVRIVHRLPGEGAAPMVPKAMCERDVPGELLAIGAAPADVWVLTRTREHPHPRLAQLQADPSGRLREVGETRVESARGIHRARIHGAAGMLLVEGEGALEVRRLSRVEGAPLVHEIANVGTWWTSPNGRWLLRTSADGTHGAWLGRTTEPRSFVRHDLGGPVARAAISKDGRRLAFTRPDDQRVLVYDTQEARVITAIPHRDVQELLFSAGGRALITTSPGPQVKIWDTTSGARLTRPFDAAAWIGGRSLTRLCMDEEAGCLFAITPDGRLVQGDLRWLLADPSASEVARARLQAQLAAMRTLDAGGQITSMSLARWRRLRADLDR